MNALSRRRILRGALAGVPVAIGLPRLDAMLNGNGDAYANGDPLPSLFGLWFFGTGAYENWWPATSGRLSILSAGFSPLSRHLNQVTLVSGLKFESFGDYATNRHYMGASSVLAGAPPASATPGAATIDQVVAQAWKGQTPRASLEVSVCDREAISYNGANSPNRPIRDPRELMQRLFGGPALAEGDKTARARKIYLDAVKDDVTALRAELGAQDRQRLMSYLEGIDELRAGLEAMPTCRAPADTTAGIADASLKDNAGYTAIARANSKLVAMALDCGMTRVFSFSMTGFNQSHWMPAGVSNNHHELGHQGHPDLPKSTEYIIARFADTLDELASRKSGDKSLLDRAGIIVTSEVAWNHHDTNLPFVIAGGGNGKLKTGVHVTASGACTRLMYTVARALGANVGSFGAQGAKADEAKVVSDVLA